MTFIVTWKIFQGVFGHFLVVFRLFHGCFKGTSKLFQEYFNVILECVMGVPRVLLGCFCPMKFTLVAVLTYVHNSKPFLTKNILKHP